MGLVTSFLSQENEDFESLVVQDHNANIGWNWLLNLDQSNSKTDACSHIASHQGQEFGEQRVVWGERQGIIFQLHQVWDAHGKSDWNFWWASRRFQCWKQKCYTWSLKLKFLTLHTVLRLPGTNSIHHWDTSVSWVLTRVLMVNIAHSPKIFTFLPCAYITI